MTNRSKQKGTTFETAIVNYLRAHGAIHAERRALAGSADLGDVTGIPGLVLEAKACKTFDLAGWVKELEAEIANANADHGFVIAKAPRRPIEDAYCIFRLAQLPALLADLGYIAEVPVP